MALPRPVAQFDPTACWAASLEWWARATGRPVVTQLNLVNMYRQHWDTREVLEDGSENPDYGTVSRNGLLSIWRDTRWNMLTTALGGSLVTAEFLRSKIAIGPCMIGYYEPSVQGNHVVSPWTVVSPNAGVMNPDGGYIQNIPMSRFQSTSEILLAWPSL